MSIFRIILNFEHLFFYHIIKLKKFIKKNIKFNRVYDPGRGNRNQSNMLLSQYIKNYHLKFFFLR